jgi:hypothetical protein
VWIRRRFTPNDGAGNRVLTVHYSTQSRLLDKSAVTWTLLGTTTTAGATTVYASATSTWMFGALTTATAPTQANKTAYWQIAATHGGAAVAAIDFRRPMTNSFVCETGQTVTVASTYNPAQATGGNRPLYRASDVLLGGRAGLDFVSSDSLVVAGTVSLAQPSTVVLVATYDAVTGAQMLVGLDGASNFRGVGMQIVPSTEHYMHAGVALAGGTPVVGTRYLVHAYFNGASSVLKINGTTVASGTASTTPINQLVLGAGLTSPSTYANYFDGRMGWLDIIPGDATAHADWSRYYAWLRNHFATAA